MEGYQADEEFTPGQLVLPPGWEELMDTDTGQPYYFNTRTGQTTWECPPAHSLLTPTNASQGKGNKKRGFARLGSHAEDAGYADEDTDGELTPRV